jgi:hypothetical protein
MLLVVLLERRQQQRQGRSRRSGLSALVAEPGLLAGSDQRIAHARCFDIHAYPDADTTGLTTAQLQALSADIYRDYWDPTYVSTSGTVNQIYATSIQPNRTIPFRIPRMKAMVNAIYPGTPLSFTEWSAAFYERV